jgi:hypothetical protein
LSNHLAAFPLSSPPAPREPRTVSGEQRIALPADPPSATLVSEKFHLPEEAVPPPASETGKATTRMGVPESLKLLRAAVPTSHGFEPIPLPPRLAATDPAESGLVAAAALPSTRRERRPGRSESANALALFVLFISVSAVATRLIGSLLFR